MKMLNLCIFNGDMSRGGGTERITQILANGLAKTEKYHVSVLNLNNETETSYFPLDEHVEFLILKKRKLTSKIIELFRLVRKNKIDILINVDIMLGIYSLPVSFIYPRLKLISWEMFNIGNDIGSHNTMKIRKLSLKRSAYYVNLTKGDMDAFLNEFKIKCPITYIYNPCVTGKGYTEYDSESKTIMTAGHFFYTKGYDLAVEVARIVLERHPDCQWKFYGDGVKFEEIKQLVNKYQLSEKIIFCGRSKQIDDAYKKAAMYVMTSRTEGFGLVLTEAKSYNLPALSFDIDFGPREIIENNVSGYLVEAFDIQEMADRICELIENKKKRIQFSLHAKDNIEKFSEDKFIASWCEIIDKVR